MNVQTADHKAIFVFLVTDAKTVRFTGNTNWRHNLKSWNKSAGLFLQKTCLP